MKIILCLLPLVFASLTKHKETVGKYAHQPEAQLAHDLQKGYSTVARPVNDPKQTVDITIEASIVNYRYCDEEKVLTVNSFIMDSWKDENAKWDPEEYGNIEMFYPHADSLWTPDIFGWSNTKPPTSVTRPVRLVVMSTGQVTLVDPREFEGHCDNLSTTQRNCTIRIGSWVHNDNEISLKVTEGKANIEVMRENPLWKMKEAKQEINVLHFGEYPQGYPNLYMRFVLEKNDNA